MRQHWIGAVLLMSGSLVMAAVPIDVREHGAVGDGIAKDTAAIQRAIDACGSSGGGRVLFPPEG